MPYNPISVLTYWFNISKDIQSRSDIDINKSINFQKFNEDMEFIFSNYQDTPDFKPRSIIDLWFIFSVIKQNDHSINPYLHTLRTLVYRYIENFSQTERVRLFHIWDRMNYKPDTSPDDIDLFSSLFHDAIQHADALDESYRNALFKLKEKFYPNVQMDTMENVISLSYEQEKKKALNLLNYWINISRTKLLDIDLSIDHHHLNAAIQIILTYFEKNPNEFCYNTNNIWHLHYLSNSVNAENNHLRILGLTISNIHRLDISPTIKLLKLFFSKNIYWHDLQSEHYQNIGTLLLEHAIQKCRINTDDVFKLLIILSSLNFSYISLSQNSLLKKSFDKLINTHFNNFETKAKFEALKLLKSIHANPITLLDEQLYLREINYYKNLENNRKLFITDGSELFYNLNQFKKSKQPTGQFNLSNINSATTNQVYFNSSPSTLSHAKSFLNNCWNDPTLINALLDDHSKKLETTNKPIAGAHSLQFTEIQIKEKSYLLLAISGKYSQEIYKKLALKVNDHNKTTNDIELVFMNGGFFLNDYNALLQEFKGKIQGTSYFNKCVENNTTIALMILFSHHGNDIKIKGSVNTALLPVDEQIQSPTRSSFMIFVPKFNKEGTTFIQLNNNKIALLQACCAFCRANKPHAMEILALAGNYGVANANKNLNLTRRLLKQILLNNNSTLIPAEPVNHRPASTASVTTDFQKRTAQTNSFQLLEEEDASLNDDNPAIEDSTASDKRQSNKAVTKRKKTTSIKAPTPTPMPAPTTPGTLTNNASPALFSKSCAIMTAVGAGAVILAALTQLNN